MFESLSDRLQSVFNRLRGKGRVSEADVNEAMREVRQALLEADVSFRVVKDFIARVKERSVGVDVLESLSPVQQVVKIVNDELVTLLGGTESRLNLAPSPPTVIMLCGLQGTGKTTLCGKLAAWFKKQGRNPLMVACDIYRPAAIKQLQVLGGQINVPVFALTGDQQKSPPTIARQAIQQASEKGNDIVLLDTAGRLAIDEELMDELGQMRAWVKPHEILLVVDAMVGQDAVNFAQEFNEKLAITGFVMTKMDGDTRGGAALSIRAITGVPIKFLGTGEKLDALEQFYPDRLASRILGMGDILSLIEKAQEAVDEKKAAELEKKLQQNKFDLNDFLDQMQQMKKLGPLENLMKLLPTVPGMTREMMSEVNIDPKIMVRKEAIVQSMTPQERAHPQIITGPRRRRIAVGCGQSVQDVNQFLNEFEQMRKVIHTMMAQQNKGKPGWGGKGGSPGGGSGGLGVRPRGGPKMPKGGKSGKRFGFPFGR
ncbi:MAG TPA: signal recognition particle protein [Chthonomonadaceae bacterium]|nr:signal recognition particle protein [Chthonomonadaceae bacterium]